MDIEEDNSEESKVNMNESSDEEDKNDSIAVPLCNTDYKTEINFLEEHYSVSVYPEELERVDNIVVFVLKTKK